jgi:DNA-binding transcriptional LysR family regulator
MNAKMQYKLTSTDLEILLTISRSGTLAAAGERLGVDSSTVFRSVQRIERGLGQRLFTRGRSGYRPNEITQSLTVHAEHVEASLEAARSVSQQRDLNVSGSVRITTTDTILHGLIAPALTSLKQIHPLLNFDIQTGNGLANLSHRDADIALRATKRPPGHLIGKMLGSIRLALFVPRGDKIRSLERHLKNKTPWIAPDDALPEHPSVVWRKKYAPRANLQYRVDSILSVGELISQGLGIGILPLFFAKNRSDLRQVGEALEDSETSLWLLTHTDARHLRRVSTVFTHFSEHIRLT